MGVKDQFVDSLVGVLSTPVVIWCLEIILYVVSVNLNCTHLYDWLTKTHKTQRQAHMIVYVCWRAVHAQNEFAMQTRRCILYYLHLMRLFSD